MSEHKLNPIAGQARRGEDCWAEINAVVKKHGYEGIATRQTLINGQCVTSELVLVDNQPKIEIATPHMLPPKGTQ